MDKRKVKSRKPRSPRKVGKTTVSKCVPERLVPMPSIFFVRYAEQAGKKSLPADKMKSLLEEGGVYKRLLKPGEEVSLPVTDNCNVFMHQETFVEKNGVLELVASTRNVGPPANVAISGPRDSGVKTALKSMRRREIAEFRIVPELAWGIPGVEKDDDAITHVKVIIELMSIFINSEGRHGTQGSPLTEDEKKKTLAEYGPKEIVEYAKVIREVANKKFQAGQFQKAYSSYHWTISVLDDYAKIQADKVRENPHVSSHECDKFRKCQVEILKQAALYSNLALCSSRLKDYETTAKICEMALLVKNPKVKDLKILLQYATALHQLGKFKEAMNLCTLGLDASLGLDQNHLKDLRQKIMQDIVQGCDEKDNQKETDGATRSPKGSKGDPKNDRMSSLRKLRLQYFTTTDGVTHIGYNH